MSPMLWAKHQPDRFDIYSAGLVLMQLSIPKLRTEKALKTFRRALEANDFDLFAWKSYSRLAVNVPILEVEDDAGWKLAAAMLRQRVLVVRTMMPRGRFSCLLPQPICPFASMAVVHSGRGDKP
eukprot:scaffold422320_cov33-Prasinocladus_malaysianus.AAC.1